MNRLLPQSLTEADGNAVTKLAAKSAKKTLAASTTLTQVLDGASLLAQLGRARAPHLRRLLEAWSGPIALVPTITSEPTGLPITRSVAEHLADELSLHATPPAQRQQRPVRR